MEATRQNLLIIPVHTTAMINTKAGDERLTYKRKEVFMQNNKHDATIKLSFELFQPSYTDLANSTIAMLRKSFNESTDFGGYNDVQSTLDMGLYINGKKIFSYCNLSTLIAMCKEDGDFYPATCPDCGEPGCAGFFSPVRVVHQHGYVILVVRRPARSSRGRHVYRAYRISKKNYFEEILKVVMVRIRMENDLGLWHGELEHTDREEESGYKEKIANLWGLNDVPDYQYAISCEIRRERTWIIENFLKWLNPQIDK